MNGLEEYQDYIYRVDVADGNNNTIGTEAVVKTYCSGKNYECTIDGKCQGCAGTGKCQQHSLGSTLDLSSSTRTVCGITGASSTSNNFYAYRCSNCGYYLWVHGCGSTAHRYSTDVGYSSSPVGAGSVSSKHVNGGSNAWAIETLDLHPPHLACGGTGFAKCEHDLMVVHDYCSHKTDDSNHKWHYSRM